MAISEIIISQDNKLDNCDLLSIHNPLSFISIAVYSTPVPDFLNVKLYKHTDFVGGKDLVETFKSVLFDDIAFGLIAANQRRFVFIADTILRGYIDSFDEFDQVLGYLQFCNGFTQIFTIRFEDPSNPAMFAETTFTALHASSQISESPSKNDLFNNVAINESGKSDGYVYFYSKQNDFNLTFTIDA